MVLHLIHDDALTFVVNIFSYKIEKCKLDHSKYICTSIHHWYKLFFFSPLFIACEVTFENTKVPIENVIGEVGGGFKVIIPNHTRTQHQQIVLFGMLQCHVECVRVSCVCISTDCNEHSE